MPDSWWRGALMYQLYPRSFYDSRNDGIGDIPGITEKLDYIADLGVDGIWISPCFQSPMKDYGYDVSDYKNIDPIFGNIDDFDKLLDKAHKLNLRILLDLVLSHTSDQHRWFKESRESRDNPKFDWYVWADPRPDGSAPNNWQSCFGGQAWTFNPKRGQYYLHNFLSEQPDLNFHNPDVQDAVLDIAKFWLDKGVDGFRMDVVNFYFHDPALRDNPPRTEGVKYALQFESFDPYSMQQHIFDKSRPENLVFLKRFRKLMDKYEDRMTIGEVGDDHPYRLSCQYTAGADYLNTTYNTHMMSGKHKELTAALVREPVEEFINCPENKGSWPSWAFSNHDVVRAASRWHPNPTGFDDDPRLSRMLLVLLGSLQGTVFIYQGEELGLPEAELKFEELQDPWGIYLWPEWQGRDGCRTPMPWTNDENGGFSKTKPWLPVPDRHIERNPEDQEKRSDSMLNFSREFIHWRKKQSTMTKGDIDFIDTTDKYFLMFTRTHNDETFYCMFNMKDRDFSFTLEGNNLEAVYESKAAANATISDGTVTLPPYGFFIGKIKA